MRIDEYAKCDGTELARLISVGEVSTQEVEYTARAAIESVEPELNAIVDDLFDKPLAANSDGPFNGVPFLIKDLVLHAANIPVEFGCRMLKGFSFPHDTELLSRFREAGLTMLGRTNTPELGFSPTTEPVANGPTHNPWMLGRSPGGSSGGSSAMVAAGAVPMAHANDGGGSIRIPAAQCGLVGLKPSRGRVPLGPDFDGPLGGMGIEFAVTRTVRDCAALLDAVEGSCPGELFLISPPSQPYVNELNIEPDVLRIAVSDIPISGVEIDPEVTSSLNTVTKVLEDQGHVVVEDKPEVNSETHFNVNLVYWTSFAAEVLQDLGAALDVTPSSENVELVNLKVAKYGSALSAVDLLHAEAGRNEINRAVCNWFESYDLFVTPTCACAAWEHGLLNSNDPDLGAVEWTERLFKPVPFTSLFNLTGQPALTLPLGMSSDHRPIGIQFVAKIGREDILFQLAAQLEQMLPWVDRRPAIHVVNVVQN